MQLVLSGSAIVLGLEVTTNDEAFWPLICIVK